MTQVKEKQTVKIWGKEYQINPEVVNKIHEIAENATVKPIIKKSNDISTNINNGYYDAKKYEYISTSTIGERGIEYSKMREIVEDIVNSTSTPRDYQEDIKNAYKYLKHIIGKQNNATQNNDTWEEDFKIENQVSDDIMSKVNELINQSSIDSPMDRYYFAEDVIEIYNMGKNSKK